MHDYLLDHMARSTSTERQRQAADHHLGQAARQAPQARSTGLAARIRAYLRIRPIVEPVRATIPRATVQRSATATVAPVAGVVRGGLSRGPRTRRPARSRAGYSRSCAEIAS
jgi:hypothetical protein